MAIKGMKELQRKLSSLSKEGAKEFADITKFLHEADNENRYILVRKVIVIISIYSAQINLLSRANLRSHSMSNLSLESDGSYRVTLPPCDEKETRRVEEIW